MLSTREALGWMSSTTKKEKEIKNLIYWVGEFDLVGDICLIMLWGALNTDWY